MPATAVPTATEDPKFAAAHGGPQPGVASDTKQSGTIMIAPQSGPRSHQCSGQVVMPTRKPIVQRATYQAHTAIDPLM